MRAAVPAEEPPTSSTLNARSRSACCSKRAWRTRATCRARGDCALLVFDEGYGLLPTAPRQRATHRPIVALMKQARAFGAGVMVASQNPMDLDCQALSNAGFWTVGRLQTDARSRARRRQPRRLANANANDNDNDNDNERAAAPPSLAPAFAGSGRRWFLVRAVHSQPNNVLRQPRRALSDVRGTIVHR